MALRLVMMGTGEFALPTFQSLLDSGRNVVGLFTQPDRVGRGHHHHINPLKEAAIAHGVPVYQPERVNAPESIAALKALRADLCVVAAYGQILSAELLQTPRLGAINVHASLLPKYRGAAPVQYAVLMGEAETGVTIFQIEPRLDAGPMLAVAKTPIGRKETSGELEERLAKMSVELVGGVLDDFEAGRTRPVIQNSTAVTKAPKIPKSAGQIDWSKTALQIDCHVRGMQPWPAAFTTLELDSDRHIRLIVLEVEPAGSATRSAEPGTIVDTSGGRLVVQTGEGLLELVRVKPDGKRAMQVAEFSRGQAIRPGIKFLANSPQ